MSHHWLLYINVTVVVTFKSREHPNGQAWLHNMYEPNDRTSIICMQTQLTQQKCNHIHMLLHFLCLLPQKTRHKQGNLTAMQTPPYCKRKGGKSLDTWAYCKHCDSPLMVASCKVSGVPHIKQTGPRLIKWVWQTSTQTIYHFSMPPCEIKIRQPCVHTVQLSLLFFILWGRKKIQLLRQTVNYMIVCIIATQRLQFIVGM